MHYGEKKFNKFVFLLSIPIEPYRLTIDITRAKNTVYKQIMNKKSNKETLLENESPKVYLVLEEDTTSPVAHPGLSYIWEWGITYNGQSVANGRTNVAYEPQWVADNVASAPGITGRPNRDGYTGNPIRLVFMSLNSETGIWEENGWVLSAMMYDVFGVSDEGLEALNNNQNIASDAKPITRETCYGMTTFLAQQLTAARCPGFDHWYAKIPGNN